MRKKCNKNVKKCKNVSVFDLFSDFVFSAFLVLHVFLFFFAFLLAACNIFAFFLHVPGPSCFFAFLLAFLLAFFLHFPGPRFLGLHFLVAFFLLFFCILIKFGNL